jgi:hypothetical protein
MFFGIKSEYDKNLELLKVENQKLISGEIDSFTVVLSFRKYKNFKKFMGTIIKKIWQLTNEKIEKQCQHELDHYKIAKSHNLICNFQITFGRKILNREKNLCESCFTPSIKLHGKSNIDSLNEKELKAYLEVALAPEVPSDSDLEQAEEFLKRL